VGKASHDTGLKDFEHDALVARPGLNSARL